MNKLIFFISGFIFSIGLGVSGMTNPEKVRGFLDITGDWNPALIFVMIGAIFVHSLSYFFIKKMKSPIYNKNFSIPNKRNIDYKIILGSVCFGVGWGLSGYCPGPALASLHLFSYSILTFTVSMLIGFIIFHNFFKNKGF